MSDSFEFHAKADEWMDVTPKEEVLAAELKRLKDAFEKVSEQLDACRLENDLLKDHKKTLEHDREHLEAVLDAMKIQVSETVSKLSQTQREARAAQTAAAEREATLQATLVEKEEVLTKVNGDVVSMQQAQQRREQQYVTTVQKSDKARDDLVRENKSLREMVALVQRDNGEQLETITRFYKEVEASRANEAKLQKALDQVTMELEKERMAMSGAKKATGAIASLAEDLRGRKISLERLLSQKEHTLVTVQTKEATASAQVVALQKRLEEVESTTASRMQYLEGCLEDQSQVHEQLQEERVGLEVQLSDLKSQNIALEQDCQALREHLLKMESGRHEWLEQRSDLEESLEETFRDLEDANERLHQSEIALLAARLEKASFESLREQYEGAAIREEALRLMMQEQKRSFERRLEEIRSILGLNFSDAIHAEVRSLKNELPICFRVPLLAGKQVF